MDKQMLYYTCLTKLRIINNFRNEIDIYNIFDAVLILMYVIFRKAVIIEEINVHCYTLTSKDMNVMERFHNGKNKWVSAWDFQQSGMCDQQSLRSACTYAQSDQSLCMSLEYSMTVKRLAELHLEFLSRKGGCTSSSESIHVKMPHCWKSHVVAQII